MLTLEEKLIRFFEIAEKLKSTKRSGWISHLNLKNSESVADHSFACCLIAMVLAGEEKINEGKMVQMLLLHDLQEAVTGDFDAYAKQKIGIQKVKSQQTNAMQIITSLLPEGKKKQYLALWDEFENKTTQEAILANDIDKLEMLIQAIEYEKQGYSASKLDTFWNSAQNQIQTPTGQKWFNLLKQKRTKT